MRVAWAVAVLAVVLISAPPIALVLNRVPFTAPPGLGARLKAYATSNTVDTRHPEAFPERMPREYGREPQAMLDTVREAIEQLGWSGVQEDGPRRLRAVVTSRLLRFKDDVTVELEPTASGGTRIHFRSASRVGRGDLGANTRHLIDFFERVETLVPAQRG